MILVTGATGNFGYSTAQYLQQKGIPIAAASNNLQALQEKFDDSTSKVVFDWDKPETFANALKGISAVYLISPPFTSNFHEKALPFLEEAKKGTVKHIVLNTALFAGREDSIFYQTEQLVKQSGIGYTIIRPGFLFQNFINYDLQSVRNGVFTAPSGTGRASYVDLRNVGEASTVILENPTAHQGKIYAITGAEALTHDQMVDMLSVQLSRPVVHINPSAEEYIDTLTNYQVPAFIAKFMAMLYTTVAQGQWEEVSDDYKMLTGKTPTAFSDFIKEYRQTFLATEKL